MTNIFADDIFKRIFFNKNVWILIKISLKGPINNIPALVQIMTWRSSGDKPLSEPMINLPTHISVFGAGFENNLSVGQVAQKIHLSWCCPKLSQI